MNIKVYDIDDGKIIKNSVKTITSDDILELSEEQGGSSIDLLEDEKFFVPEIKDIYNIKDTSSGDKISTNIICISDNHKKFKEKMEETSTFFKELKLIEEKIDGDNDNILHIMKTELVKANDSMVDLSQKIYDTFCNMYEGVIIDKKLTLRKGIAHEYKHRRNIPVNDMFKLMVENKMEIINKLNKNNSILFEYLTDLIIEFNLSKDQGHYTNYYNDCVRSNIRKLCDKNMIKIELKKPFSFYYATRYDTIETRIVQSIVIEGVNINYYDNENDSLNNDVPRHVKKFLFDTIPEIKTSTFNTINILKNLNNRLGVHNSHMDKFCSKYLVLAGLCKEDSYSRRRNYGGFSEDKYTYEDV